jgi:hypothetical protein
VRDRRPEFLAVVVLLLACAAGALCAAGTTGGGDEASDLESLVDGLGAGAVGLPLPCENQPGIDGADPCTMLTSPEAGGIAYCPVHSGPSLRR